MPRCFQVFPRGTFQIVPATVQVSPGTEGQRGSQAAAQGSSPGQPGTRPRQKGSGGSQGSHPGHAVRQPGEPRPHSPGVPVLPTSQGSPPFPCPSSPPDNAHSATPRRHAMPLPANAVPIGPRRSPRLRQLQQANEPQGAPQEHPGAQVEQRCPPPGEPRQGQMQPTPVQQRAGHGAGDRACSRSLQGRARFQTKASCPHHHPPKVPSFIPPGLHSVLGNHRRRALSCAQRHDRWSQRLMRFPSVLADPACTVSRCLLP